MFEATFQYIAEERIFYGQVSRVMGTRFEMLIAGVDAEKGERCWALVITELQRLDKMLNRFDTTSEVSRVNKRASREPFVVSDEFWSILKECEKYHQMSYGVFDVTLSNFSQLKFHPKTNSISFLVSDLLLDFGGYAKGYALEKIRKILKNESIKHAFVNFGNSSVMALGKHPYGNSWKVNIENPFLAGDVLNEFILNDTTLTTSGNTPDYSAHIINPISQKRVNERKCVCIVTDNACDGEVLSTALVASPFDEKQKIIDNFNADKIIEYNL